MVIVSGVSDVNGVGEVDGNVDGDISGDFVGVDFGSTALFLFSGLECTDCEMDVA